MLRGNALFGEGLKGKQAIGTGKRMQDRARISVEILINVGAAQSHDQRPVRVKRAKVMDAAGAPPGMERDHEICRHPVVVMNHPHVMTKRRQDLGPPPARRIISGS